MPKVIRNFKVPEDFAERSAKLNRSYLLSSYLRDLVDSPVAVAAKALSRRMQTDRATLVSVSVTIDSDLMDALKSLSQRVDLSTEQLVRLATEAKMSD